jgi:hypothetical protein
METRCQKCGAALAADQAFCSKCGAVVGMGDAGQSQGGEWNLAATVVGKKLPTTPRASPSGAAAQPERSGAADYRPAGQVSAQPAPGGGFSPTLLAVIGFVVVLVIGGLLILLFYLNSRG